MAKTADEIQAFQAEIQAWLEKHDLTHDIFWRTAQEHWGEDREDYAGRVYLVLTFGGDLNKVMFILSDYQNWNKERREEFDEIVERHDMCYDFEDFNTMYFMSFDEY